MEGWPVRKQPGFFDVDDRLRRLSDLGDQLEAYGSVVDFEMFRPELASALAYSDGAKGGRPPYDAVMMFRILVIQARNNLSDERTGFLINDRLSFMRFLGPCGFSGSRSATGYRTHGRSGRSASG